MPLVRVSLPPRSSVDFRKSVSDAIHKAMVGSIKIPADDRFQIFCESPEGGLVYDKTYLGIDRSPGFLCVQITLNAGRSVELKKALYKAIVDELGRKAAVRPQDVLINLIEVPKENWSFGNGEAPYA